MTSEENPINSSFNRNQPKEQLYQEVLLADNPADSLQTFRTMSNNDLKRG